MKKIQFAIFCSIATIALGLSAWSLVRSYNTPTQEIEYTMYVGTNDKETYKLEMPLEEARSIVHNTMMDHFSDGFTMYDAKGVWRDEDKVITLEYSFVCVIEYANRTEVYKAADELIVKLNQSTILVVSNSVSKVDFYTGSK